MRIGVQNSLADSAQYSYLTSTVNSGTTALPIRNINSFNANYAIQIGKTGEEQSEVKVITSSAPSGTALAITANTTYEHPSDTQVFNIKYDQVIFLRSTTGTAGTATALTGGTVPITPDSVSTEFDDTTGASTYAYRAQYYNSVTSDISALSDWLTQEGFAFYSLAKIRERIKRKFPNATFIGDDEVINDWVNEWLEKMNNTLIDINKDYALGTVDVGFGTAGLGTITSTDFKEVRRLWVTYDATTYAEATKQGITDYYPTQIFNTTHPYFNYQGDTVFQVRPSDTAGTARIVYYKIQPVLVGDTDELPASMHAYSKSFVDYGQSQGLYLDDKDSKAKRKEDVAQAELERFKMQMTPRAMGGQEEQEIVEPVSGEEGSW